MKFKLLIIAALTFFISSCNSGTSKKGEEQKEITLGLVDGWAEGVAMTNVAKEILTQNGYEVTIKKAAVDMIFASLANNDVDVFMDAWLPQTHKEKVAKFADKLESLGTNFEEAKIGLVVPAYVTINSIEELNANKDKFEGKLIGIEKGAGITSKTDLAIKEYKLNFEQMNSSSIAMLSELQKAISEKRWIAVAGWAPHWKFGRWDLKFLDDPKKVYGETEHIEVYARKGFKTEDTYAANLFSKFKLSSEQMSSLLAKMEDGKDKSTVAKTWISENQEMVNTWLAK
ncbi:glycine betaine ABC transporter substrate-binding protein [Plebeiibacterium sediminum]|uniref:Glycine betaine ABC transporter substrate-binding protein n=1 Tax=Plebeiibacterium sediminum TaxID=2992112 RepID=A0AAE3M3S6_9BACT|nr:glycine betaine ABC transporter substrate-binding protein [Plebeiobacterium sediminum]MCW3786544.1 glycine betaine ABC transporter substrate-binding protein [Plebeiobacterium sediminum]